MQLAGEPLALELLGGDDPAQRVALDPLRELHRDRRSCGEGLREPHVVVGEACICGAGLVVGSDHADRPAVDDERHPDSRAGADLPRQAAVYLGVVDDRVDPLTAAALEHAASLRLGTCDRRPAQLFRAFAGRSHDSQLVSTRRQRDHDDARVEQFQQPLRDELEQAVELGLPRERTAHLDQRLELPRPARRRLVQARVLDRDRRLRGQQLDQLLIFRAEVASALLLGQIEVAVGDPAQQHRHAEERRHRRMVRREADRARVVADRVQAQRVRVGDERAEDSAALGQVADRRPCGVVDAVGDEALEPRARPVDHAQRRVARAGQLGGQLGQPLKQAVEGELGSQGYPGLDEGAQPWLTRRRRLHAGSVLRPRACFRLRGGGRAAGRRPAPGGQRGS